MSKLSFIMPIYEPDLILFEKVLRALAVQSLKDWELIAVLDGPCPEAEQVIKRVMNKIPNHYKVVELPHGGVQKARNAGFEHAYSDYVVWFDCDCVIEVHTAKAWVDMLEKYPDYSFVYSGYQFLNEAGNIESEPFDPWTLRVRNYISACFPIRREDAARWNEDLESLQDWDFWLSVVEKGGKGLFLPGFAFSTAYPTAKSISGKGCATDQWLGRMDKIKALHNIPIRKICVTTLYEKFDGIALAKALDADFDIHPNDKPNHYETVIQIGFSVKPKEFEHCASAWGKQHKKFIFWTADDIETIYHGVSLSALKEYAPKINELATQFVEDKKANEIMEAAGFKVAILPIPLLHEGDVDELPAEPRFLCDVTPEYGYAFNAIQKALPDIKLEPVNGTQEIKNYTGLVCFHKDGITRQSVKRMIVAGRKVISNIQAPGAGYIDDCVPDGVFMKEFVNNIRREVNLPVNKDFAKYWADANRVEKLKEAIS